MRGVFSGNVNRAGSAANAPAHGSGNEVLMRPDRTPSQDVTADPPAAGPHTAPHTSIETASGHGDLPQSPRSRTGSGPENSDAVPSPGNVGCSWFSFGPGPSDRPGSVTLETPAGPHTLPHTPPSPCAVYPEPTRQKARGRSGCVCVGPCYWCGEPIEGRHEHDHFPLPHRHGGEYTVPSCHRCHNLKDRFEMADWAPSAHQSAADGFGLGAFLILMFVSRIVRDDMDDEDWFAYSPGEAHELLVEDWFAYSPGEAHELLVKAVAGCTTCEARIATARHANHALDYFKRTRGSAFPEPDCQEQAA